MVTQAKDLFKINFCRPEVFIGTILASKTQPMDVNRFRNHDSLEENDLMIHSVVNFVVLNKVKDDCRGRATLTW